MSELRLTSDIVLLATQDDVQPTWNVLVIQRGWDPFKGSWALPGGHVDDGETFRDAAFRELAEETGITAPKLKMFGVYDAPDRDPRGRYISCAYLYVVDEMEMPNAGDDATDAQWMPVAELLATPRALAFDHAQILADAVRVATPA